MTTPGTTKPGKTTPGKTTPGKTGTRGYPVDNLPPVHPGEHLKDDLDALGWSGSRFAAHLGVPANAINLIMAGKRGISAEMALRLAQAFATTPDYWLTLQNRYDLKLAQKELAGRQATVIGAVSDVAALTGSAVIRHAGTAKGFVRVVKESAADGFVVRKSSPDKGGSFVVRRSAKTGATIGATREKRPERIAKPAAGKGPSAGKDPFAGKHKRQVQV